MDLESYISAKQHKVNSLDEKIQILKNRIPKETTEDNNESLETISFNVGRMEKRYEELLTKNDFLKRQNERMLAKIKENEGKINVLYAEYGPATEENEILKSKLGRLNNELRTTERDFANLKRKFEQVSGCENTESPKRDAIRESDKEAKELELDRLLEKKKDLELHLFRFSNASKNTSERTKRIEYEKQFDELAVEIAELRDEIKELK